MTRRVHRREVMRTVYVLPDGTHEDTPHDAYHRLAHRIVSERYLPDDAERPLIPINRLDKLQRRLARWLEWADERENPPIITPPQWEHRALECATHGTVVHSRIKGTKAWLCTSCPLPPK